jgi:DNA repair protein SbcD/Mre11
MTTDLFRVLHTADWHLGKTLHDHDRTEEHIYFLKFLMQTIKDKKIDALIIAGDVFDSTNPPPIALRLYYEFLADVYHNTDCAVVVTAGNHDSPAHLEAPKDVLRALNIHVVGVIPKNLEEALILLPSREKPRLAIAALPFLRDKDLRTSQLGQSQDEIRKNIQEGIRKRYHDIGEAAKVYRVEGVALIATGHLTVLGANKSESERENIHIGGIGVVNTDVFPDFFSYVALGHLHRPQKVGNQEHFRYSGSPIPLSFSESADKKEIRILEFVEGSLINNCSCEIPLSRQLFQLKTSYNGLESTLNNFQPEPSTFTHWIELIIETDESTGNLHETIDRLTVGKPYKVIKTSIENMLTYDGLRINDSLNENSLGDLLGNPREVFIQRLDQAAIIDVEERESLVTAFAELYDLILESQRQSFASQSEGNVML